MAPLGLEKNKVFFLGLPHWAPSGLLRNYYVPYGPFGYYVPSGLRLYD